MATILLYIAALIVALAGLFAALLQLPDVSLAVGIGQALTTAGGYIAVVDAFFPIGTLLTAFIGTHIALEAGVFVYKGIMWVVRKYPGVS